MEDDRITDVKYKDDEKPSLPLDLSVTLTVLEGYDKGSVFTINGYETTLGRRKTDIVLNDTSASREHAKIVYESGAFFVEDLKSSNGTFVNGRKIGKKQLNDRDHIKIGDSVLSFNLTQPQGVKEDETDPSIARTDEHRSGERKFVTVIFADISGFSGIAEQMDPEELTAMVNGCFERLIKIAYKHKGTVDKLIGDCVMVLFGAPITHEDDTERSLLCSLEMMQAVDQYSEKIGRPLKIAIGINAGTVVAGTVGSNLKHDYTVMGNAVNIAQKLQKQAKAGEIRVSQEIVNLTAKNFQFQGLEPFFVRGIQQPIQQYQLLGSKLRQSPNLTSNIARPLVGRKAELLKIKQLCDEALKGQARTSVISGEIGVGKSRLAKELSLYAMAKGLKPHRVIARSITANLSYSLIYDLIRSLLEFDENEERDAAAVTAHFIEAGLDGDEARFLLEIFPESLQLGRIRDIPAQLKMEGVINAAVKLLSAVTQRTPSFIHVDALQWADLLSINLLGRFFAVLEGKVFVLMTARDDFNLPWKDVPVFKLEPLAYQDAVDFVLKMVGIDTLPVAIVENILQRSGRNPLFMEEIVSSFMEQDNWADDVQSAWSNMTISATLTSLLQSRLDRLTAPAKETLKHAAAMGSEFDPRLLAKIMDNESATQQSLEELTESGYIDVMTDFNPPIYCFHNQMIREVALSSMLKDKLRKLNKQVATVMEQAFSQGDTLISYAMLAEYFEKAHDHTKAVDYYGKAAESLAGNGDNRTAIQLYQNAIRLQLKESPDQPDIAAALLIKSAQTRCLSENFDKAVEDLNQVTRLLRGGKNTPPSKLLNAATKELGRISRLQGKLNEAEKTLKDLLVTMKSEDDPELYIETLREIGIINFKKGNYEDALHHYHQGLQKAKAQKDHVLIARCLNEVGLVHTYKNQLGQALNFFLESLELREKSGNLHSVAVVLPNIASAYQKLGEHDKAVEHLVKAIQITQKLGDRRTQLIALHNLADVMMDRGMHLEARERYLEAAKLANQLGYEEGTNLSSIFIALIDILGDKVDAGYARADAELARAKAMNNAENAIHATIVLGIACHRREQFEQAGKLLREALKSAQDIGNQKLVNLVEQRLREYPTRDNS